MKNEQIIREGSTRQKIKLFFTDLAYINTANFPLITHKHKPLTDKEKREIRESVVLPKDVKYWEELIRANKAFLMFKSMIMTDRIKFYTFWLEISKYSGAKFIHIKYGDTLNKVLDLIADDKLKAEAVEVILRELKIYKVKKEIKKSTGDVEINTNDTEFDAKIGMIVSLINKNIPDIKNLIINMKFFVDTYLPLKPYKEFLTKSEESIIKYINDSREAIAWYKRAKIKTWEDVKVEVSEEDIDYIRRAGY
jgi:hypothetical protein